MSVQAVNWALSAKRTGPLPAETRLVLLVMADRADQHGRNVYLAASTIAAKLGTTERSVRRHFSTLRERSLIVPGDPEKIPEKIAHNRRPVIYDLPINTKATPDRNVTPVAEPPAWLDEPEEDPWASMAVDSCPDTNVIPMRRPGVTPMTPRGDRAVRFGVTAVSANPVVDPPSIPISSRQHVLFSWVRRVIDALDLADLSDDMDAATRRRFA